MSVASAMAMMITSSTIIRKSRRFIVPPLCRPVSFLESLESMGFIEVSSYDVSDDGDVRISAYEITPCGRDSLAAFHKQQHERACEEAEKRRKETLEEESRRKDARRSWVQWTITTVLTIASFFTGAVVEMFTGFIEWIASLFH